jgi:uncharacterized HhH-GPD family protein
MTNDDAARALLTYGRELAASNAKPGIVVTFTPNDAANQFVLKNPNAFLFAVIFDQGIQAERAWAGPYYLSQRLGHFDLERIAAMPLSELITVIRRPPALHRYVNNIPDWLIAAAEKLLAEYDGDSSNVWNDSPTATDLISRLTAFKGIGPKKAAMATQILMRDMGVPLRRTAGTQVAYDAHIRRVFLRTGLVGKDDPAQINSVARKFSPDDPGAMDLPAWYVGRNWCHPRNPECQTCRLSQVCAKLVHLAGDTGY